jgi:DNA-binding SARP family transcriptional activator
MEQTPMKTRDSFTQAKEQLDSLPDETSLAILHPDFHGQHRLFGPALKQSDRPIVFMATPAPKLTFAQWVSHLKAAYETQLKASISDLPADPKSAAAALAKAISSHGKILTIIDAYDIAPQPEATIFVAAFVGALPAGARVIIGGREMPMELLKHADLKGQTALVPVNPDKMMLDYAQSIDKTVLEVRALGPGRVLINGRLIEHWDGVLPRTLFFYFVDRGMTTRDEIFQTFWPTLSTREATNVFHVTKRKISEILGTDLTVYWSGFYRISPELELNYDVVKFAEAIQNAAIADDNEAIDLLQNAIELYHGPFLSTMDQAWVVNRRNELAMSYAEALAGLARVYRNQDVPLNALGYFLRAAATSPQREDLARAIMELYRGLGKPREALDTFERLEHELKRTLDVSPAPQTTELADEIRGTL